MRSPQLAHRSGLLRAARKAAEPATGCNTIYGSLSPAGDLCHVDGLPSGADEFGVAPRIGEKFWKQCWWHLGDEAEHQIRFVFDQAVVSGSSCCRTQLRLGLQQQLTCVLKLSAVRDCVTQDVTQVLFACTPEQSAAQDECGRFRPGGRASAMLHALFEQGDYYAGVTDPDGVLLDVNETSLNQCGYTHEQVIGLPFWETAWWKDLPHVQEKIRTGIQLASQGEVYREELDYRIADGTIRQTDFSISSVCDETGQVLYLVPTGKDVTEARRTGSALQESEERFRTLADNISQLAWMAEPDGSIVWFNRRWFDYTGSTMEQMQGSGWTTVHHPDHLPRVLRRIKRAFTTGEPWEDTIPLKRHDGTFCWFLSRMTPIRDRGGQVIRWFGTNTDITHHKHIEQQLRRSTEQLELGMEVAGLAVGEIDYDDDCIHMTPDLARMYGLPNDRLKISRKEIHSLFHPDDRPWLHERIAEAAMQDREQTLSFDHRIVRPGGEVRWLSVRKRLFQDRDEEGRIISRRSILAAQDITARKRTMAELENARQLAETANRAKSDFLANMSHEIRSPMTAILGFADLLEPSSPADAMKIKTIRDNGQFLLEVISDILDLSKIEAGKMDLEKTTFDPAKLLQDIYSMMSLRAADAGLRFETDIDGPLPLALTSDPIRIRQILINLAGNAIKFTEAGGVSLRMRYTKPEQELRFEVVDSGIGISEQDQQKLFLPFEQADPSPSRPYEGSGLGLAISQRLAELLGGRIELVSKLGEGSTFSLVIPCPFTTGVPAADSVKTRCDAGDDEQGNCASPDKKSLQAGQLKIRALIVDDRPDIRFLAQHLVSRVGGKVLTAENGVEALSVMKRERAAKRGVDIILMDVQMPKMDGITAVRHLRKDGFDLPIIALTANAMEKDRENCFAAGYTAFLTKPIDAKHLTATLRKHCQ